MHFKWIFTYIYILPTCCARVVFLICCIISFWLCFLVFLVSNLGTHPCHPLLIKKNQFHGLIIYFRCDPNEHSWGRFLFHFMWNCCVTAIEALLHTFVFFFTIGRNKLFCMSTHMLVANQREEEKGVPCFNPVARTLAQMRETQLLSSPPL